jgi:hypothetical protein
MVKIASNSDTASGVASAVTIRMPKPVKAAIDKAAFASRRSINAQVIYLLQLGLSKEEAHPKRPEEKTPIWKMDNLDDVVLQLFRDLPPEKQLALIQLLRKE